jgi:hypothetical protein
MRSVELSCVESGPHLLLSSRLAINGSSQRLGGGARSSARSAPNRPRYRAKPPVLPIGLYPPGELSERHDGLTRYRGVGGNGRRDDQLALQGLGQEGIGKHRTAAGAGGADFGHHRVAVGNEHRLAPAARRTYSLSLFFRIFSPSARIATNVAT